MMINISNKLVKRNNVNIEIVNLKISKPGIYLLTGKNGSGKTSLIKQIVSLSDSGSISYLPQETVLLENLSVASNLKAFLNHSSVKPNNELLQMLVPSDDEQIVKSMSGGQKRKLQIYIALMKASSTIILDEPFNHLDQAAIVLINEYLQTISTNKVIVIVDHTKTVSATAEVVLTKRLDFIALASNQDQIDNTKLGYRAVFSNLKFSSKLFYFLSLLILATLIFYFESNNSLDTFSYQFNDQVVAKDAINNICSDQGHNEQSRIDTYYLPQIGYIEVALPLEQRFILARNFVYPRQEFKFQVAHLENPKSDLEAYDGPMPYYDFYDLVDGEFPDDDTNQILVPTFYADYLATQMSLDSGSDVIGQTIELNTHQAVISGTYRDLKLKTTKGAMVLTAYQSEDTQTCNPMLFGAVESYNSIKLIKVIGLSIIINIVSIIILYCLEISFFNSLRYGLIRNRVLYSYGLFSAICIVLSVIYYFNYP